MLLVASLTDSTAGLGALPILLVDRISHRAYDAALVGGPITLHDVPKGLAVGIAFASGSRKSVTLAIVAVSTPVTPLAAGFPRGR